MLSNMGYGVSFALAVQPHLSPDKVIRSKPGNFSLNAEYRGRDFYGVALRAEIQGHVNKWLLIARIN